MNGRPVQSEQSAFADVYRAPEQVDPKAKLAAGVLTSFLYSLFAILIWRSFLIVPAVPESPEITAAVLPDAPRNKLPLPPPVSVHLVRPKPESVILPPFTVASAMSFAPALLAPTAADTSPLAAGGMSGTGNGSHGGSAASSGTKDDGPVACLDPAWLHAMTKRVMTFINYPSAARRSNTTGVVILHFVVRRTGQLDLVEVSTSSGSQVLDEAASTGMSSAQPLPPIPDHMHTERVDEHFEVTFDAAPVPEKRAMSLCGG